MIRMIATDLDRSLLRSDKTISPYTADVLRRCRAKGVKLVFATARPLRVTLPFTQAAEVDALIVHNGGCVYRDGVLRRRASIPIAAARRALADIAALSPNATLSVEIDDVIYMNFDPPDPGFVYTRSDFTGLPDFPADKVIAGLPPGEDLSPYARLLPEDLYIEPEDSSGIRLAYIMHRKATKWLALSELAAEMGIQPSDIAAFGDDLNDIGMLSGCGEGVAMANALPQVKAAARHVCLDNDSDGVARWLEEHVL